LIKISKIDPKYNPLGKTSSELKHDLMQYASEHTRDFIETKIDDSLLIELKIKDAISLMKIQYLIDSRTWKFADDNETIMECSLQVKDKYELELIEYLSSPARKSVFNKLEECLISE
jgi:adenylate kinase family enzyme